MQALSIYTSTIRELIGEGEILAAIDLLTKLNVSTNLGIDNTLINLKGQLKRLQKEADEGYIDRRDLRIEMNRIQRAVTNILEGIPRKLELKGKINGVTGYNFGVIQNNTFEKIINSQDNLLKISWLEDALTAAKSVCLVVTEDGGRGTGFMIEGDYLMTNNHVLPDAHSARTAYIEFNFEEDSVGSEKERYRYELDADDFVTSDKYALDVSRVKVKSNPAALPLSFWGQLTISTQNVPRVGEPVTIIQHAAGEQKRIALNANEVLGTENQYLFYKTDTLAGSSGSPVFNRHWEVIALHHAGSNFKNMPANRGILMQPVVTYLADQKVNTPTSTSPADTEKISTPTPPPSTTTFPDDGKTKLFLLYDKTEERYAAKELRKHLSPLMYITKEIDVFDMHEDKRLGFGNPQQIIEEQLKNANFVIALISPAFFVHSYPLAVKAQELGNTIIPVLVKNTDFYQPSFLGQFRSLPSDGRFISEWANEDSAYTDIVQKIRLLHRQ